MAAFYYNSISNHYQTSTSDIVGAISLAYSNHHLDQKQQQTKTWADTVEIVKEFFTKTASKISDLEIWGLLYEYKIQRRAK